MAVSLTHDEIRARLPHLYDSAAALEVELERERRDPRAMLTPGQIGQYNAILKEARLLLPDSVALREDAKEATEYSRLADVHRVLNTTVVPTLHNALPPAEYEKRR